ncbi:MAG TPA: biotin/lipoyl-containing protein [Candidatus Binatia bacterium]|nr:biotin/lipoyl-containing protein [Candidatus Binatia bacterium]
MDANEIRKLVRLMEEAGLTELEVEDRSGKIRLVRGARGAARRDGEAGRDAGSARFDDEPPSRDGAGDPEEPLPRSGGGGASRGSGAGSSESAERIPPGMTTITSPMVGTFYRAPAPDQPAFVQPGDVVRPGQVVCIIEAMKMMNEVLAETSARIVSVQAENGTSVEYGSPLFLVELLE